MRVLIVEDSRDVGEAVEASLTEAGFACDRARTLGEARDFTDVQDYAALVLDIHLPDGDGRALLRDLRRGRDTTPVLMLTAEFDITSRVDALDGGADDYLVKPFDLRELEARLRVLVRRDQGRAENALICGDLEVDPAGQIARLGGRPLKLTRRELALLNMMMAEQGRIIPKDRLFDGLFSFDRDVGQNTIELYVARLRKKLAGSRVRIETHRGLGYRIDATDG
ncbi:MAG: response regulator transcription factor [Pseudomonadota bacterium]